MDRLDSTTVTVSVYRVFVTSTVIGLLSPCRADDGTVNLAMPTSCVVTVTDLVTVAVRPSGEVAWSVTG